MPKQKQQHPLPTRNDEARIKRLSQRLALFLFIVDIALVYLQSGLDYSLSKAVGTLFFAIFAFIAYIGITDPEGTSSFNLLAISRGPSAGLTAPGCTYVVLGWIFLIGTFGVYGWRCLAYAWAALSG